MRTGFIGFLAQPNAGKSTLINQIIGEKVSTVTKKPQTTRKRVRGIYLDEKRQIVFVDPPGLIQAEKGLNHFLQKEWQSTLKECDGFLALFNIDERNIDKVDQVFQLAYKAQKPWAAVITKSDLPFAHRTQILKKRLTDEKIPFCVVDNQDAEATKTSVLELVDGWLKESEALYDTDIYTTSSLREIFCEFSLETCFELLHQEIPYQIAVRVESFLEESDKLEANMVLVVNHDRHKPIVLGEGGTRIKAIRKRTEKKLRKLLDKKVTLSFFVSSKPSWMDNKNMMKDLGYVTT